MNRLNQLGPELLYAVFYIVGLLAAIRFAIASGFSGTTLGVGLAVGFIAMATGGFLLLEIYLFRFGKGDVTKKTTFSQHLHAFWIGFFIVVIINIVGFFVPQMSILTMPYQTSSLLATASEGLGTFDKILADTGMAPFCETFIFIAHFLFAFVIVKVLGNMLNMSERTRNIFLIIFYILFSTVTFYYFHVGMVGSGAFLIAVFIYRAIMGVAIFGDKLFNIIPFATMLIAAEFGFHFANNLIESEIGFGWITIMLSDVFGMVFLGTIAFLAIAEIYNIKSKTD